MDVLARVAVAEVVAPWVGGGATRALLRGRRRCVAAQRSAEVLPGPTGPRRRGMPQRIVSSLHEDIEPRAAPGRGPRPEDDLAAEPFPARRVRSRLVVPVPNAAVGSPDKDIGPIGSPRYGGRRLAKLAAEARLPTACAGRPVPERMVRPFDIDVHETSATRDRGWPPDSTPEGNPAGLAVPLPQRLIRTVDVGLDAVGPGCDRCRIGRQDAPEPGPGPPGRQAVRISPQSTVSSFDKDIEVAGSVRYGGRGPSQLAAQWLPPMPEAGIEPVVPESAISRPNKDIQPSSAPGGYRCIGGRRPATRFPVPGAVKVVVPERAVRSANEGVQPVDTPRRGHGSPHRAAEW